MIKIYLFLSDVGRSTTFLNLQQKEVYDESNWWWKFGMFALIRLVARQRPFSYYCCWLIFICRTSNFIAYSGIADKLLVGCRTAHATLKLPLNLFKRLKNQNVTNYHTLSLNKCTKYHKRALAASADDTHDKCITKVFSNHHLTIR